MVWAFTAMIKSNTPIIEMSEKSDAVMSRIMFRSVRSV